MTKIVDINHARKMRDVKKSEYEAKLDALEKQRQQNIAGMTALLHTHDIDRGTMNIMMEFALAILNSSKICRLKEEYKSIEQVNSKDEPLYN